MYRLRCTFYTIDYWHGCRGLKTVLFFFFFSMYIINSLLYSLHPAADFLSCFQEYFVWKSFHKSNYFLFKSGSTTVSHCAVPYYRAIYCADYGRAVPPHAVLCRPVPHSAAQCRTVPPSAVLCRPMPYCSAAYHHKNTKTVFTKIWKM